jgi:hypothetical protein
LGFLAAQLEPDTLSSTLTAAAAVLSGMAALVAAVAGSIGILRKRDKKGEDPAKDGQDDDEKVRLASLLEAAMDRLDMQSRIALEMQREDAQRKLDEFRESADHIRSLEVANAHLEAALSQTALEARLHESETANRQLLSARNESENGDRQALAGADGLPPSQSTAANVAQRVVDHYASAQQPEEDLSDEDV